MRLARDRHWGIPDVPDAHRPSEPPSLSSTLSVALKLPPAGDLLHQIGFVA